MASCYGCNADLPKGVPVQRRRIVVGTSSSVRVSKRVGYFSGTKHEDKAFCATCVAKVDAEANAGKPGLLSQLFSMIFVIVIGVLIYNCDGCRSNRPPPESAPAVTPPTEAPTTPTKRHEKAHHSKEHKPPAAKPADDTDQKLLTPKF